MGMRKGVGLLVSGLLGRRARARRERLRRGRRRRPARRCARATGLPQGVAGELANACERDQGSRLLPLMAPATARREVRRAVLQRSFRGSGSLVSRQLGLVRGERRGRPGSARELPRLPGQASDTDLRGHADREREDGAQEVSLLQRPPRAQAVRRRDGHRLHGESGRGQWHVLYAWRKGGSLYTISEHVAPPYTYEQVIGHLDRMTRTLVRAAAADLEPLRAADPEGARRRGGRRVGAGGGGNLQAGRPADRTAGTGRSRAARSRAASSRRDPRRYATTASRCSYRRSTTRS